MAPLAQSARSSRRPRDASDLDWPRKQLAGCCGNLDKSFCSPLNRFHLLDEARTRLAPVERTEAETHAAALRDFVALLDELLVSRRGHAAPPWSAPKIAWRAIIIPAVERECYLDARRVLLRLCTLIHQAREVLVE